MMKTTSKKIKESKDYIVLLSLLVIVMITTIYAYTLANPEAKASIVLEKIESGEYQVSPGDLAVLMDSFNSKQKRDMVKSTNSLESPSPKECVEALLVHYPKYGNIVYDHFQKNKGGN